MTSKEQQTVSRQSTLHPPEKKKKPTTFSVSSYSIRVARVHGRAVRAQFATKA